MPNLLTNVFTSGDTSISGVTNKGANVECHDSKGKLIGKTTASKIDGTWSISVSGSTAPFTISAGDKEKVVLETTSQSIAGTYNEFATVQVFNNSEFVASAHTEPYHEYKCHKWCVEIPSNVAFRNNDHLTIVFTSTRTSIVSRN